MKVNKLEGYAPEYPARKGLSGAAKIGALAAALIAASAAAGCTPAWSGYTLESPAPTEGAPVVDCTEPAVTEDVQTEGLILADPSEIAGTPEPTEDADGLSLIGDVVVDPASIIGD